jgi:hypothetical protein
MLATLGVSVSKPTLTLKPPARLNHEPAIRCKHAIPPTEEIHDSASSIDRGRVYVTNNKTIP